MQKQGFAKEVHFECRTEKEVHFKRKRIKRIQRLVVWYMQQYSFKSSGNSNNVNDKPLMMM